MTTITKERIELFIKNPLENGLTRGEQMELARIALASLDAEPVGYFYADKPGDWYQISDGDRVPDHRRIPLYSSPQPAQVVKLPNEFISNEGIVVQIEKVMAVLAVHGIQYKRRGNACSAAMLQAGTLTNEGTKQAGNSPVIPEGSFSGLVNSARALLDVLYEFGADEVAISEYVTNLEDALRVAAAPKQ